ncbi:hypothetical protein K2X85_20065 [bacterium]|nr:hypothetical protein [bacterium]
MRRLFLLLTLPGFVGCTLETAVWSPDGKTLAVATSKGIYLSDKERNAALAVEARPWSATPVVWLPDGHGVLVVHQVAVHWPEIKKLLGPDRAKQAKELADLIVEKSPEIVDDRWKDFDLPGTYPMPIVAGAWAWLAETKPAKLKSAMKGEEFGNSAVWEKLKSYTPKINRLSLFRVDGLKATLEKDLVDSLDVIMSVRVSPDGQWLSTVFGLSKQTGNEAIPGDNANELVTELYVAPISDLDQRTRIAESTSVWTSWSPDSGSLYFVQTLPGATDFATGSICQWTREDGTPETNSTSSPRVVRLVDATVGLFSKIHAMNDGSVLFVSPERVLPSSSKTPPQSVGLYQFHPSMPSRITKLAIEPSDDVEQALLVGAFGVSRDNLTIALSTSKGGTGRLDIRNGVIQWIERQAPEPKDVWGLSLPAPMAPAWSSDDEFLFLAPPNSTLTKSGKPQVVLVGPNRQINFSQSWDWFELLH